MYDSADTHQLVRLASTRALQLARAVAQHIELCVITSLVRATFPEATHLVTGVVIGQQGPVADLLQVRRRTEQGTTVLLDLELLGDADVAALGESWAQAQILIEEGLDRMAAWAPPADPEPPGWGIAHEVDTGSIIPAASQVELLPEDDVRRVLGAPGATVPAVHSRLLADLPWGRSGSPAADGELAAEIALGGPTVVITTQPGAEPLVMSLNGTLVAVGIDGRARGAQ